MNPNCPVLGSLRDQSGYEKPSAYDDPEVDYSKQKRTPYRDFLLLKETERACLVVRWAEGLDGKTFKQKVQLALLDSTGALRTQNQATKQFSTDPQFSLSPKELEKTTIHWLLFLVRRGADLDGMEHQALCDKITAPTFECFPENLNDQSKNPCWFYLKLQPDTQGDTTFQVARIRDRCEICSREICGNNIDDDCDGKADENCDQKVDCHHPGKKRSCYSGAAEARNKGNCQEGSQVCGQDLKWGACEGEVLPKKETCNGVDDDCDGKVDEDIADCCVVGSQRACYDGPDGTAGKGICRAGYQLCVFDPSTEAGKWGVDCREQKKPDNAEVCNLRDDDCDGSVDEPEDLGLGGACNTQLKGICKAGKESCLDGKKVCAPVIEPFTEKEICNGKDDNCDGQVDELFPERGRPCKLANEKGPCAEGLYTRCESGKIVCEAIRVKEAQERCGDGVDNDCDGQIDGQDSECACKVGATAPCYTGKSGTDKTLPCKAGMRTCDLSGRWGACVGQIVPKVEVCNGKDDNCDGQIDEDFPEKGQICFLVGKKGPCYYGKYDRCGPTGAVCTPDATPAAKEICGNGKDDDCDSLIDEDCSCTDGQTQKCYRGPAWTRGSGSICQDGLMTCSGGRWGGCVQEELPKLEKCDGVDNDCDGKTDEDDAALGQACQIQGAKGRCASGFQRCQAGKLKCVSPYQSSTEVCDGLDNNCDGQVDEGDPRLGRACSVPGQKGACAPGKLACKKGAWSCEPTNMRGTEDCNGVDDDCDGFVDEIDNDSKKPPACGKQDGVCAGSHRLCAGSKGWISTCTASDYRDHNGLYELEERSCDGKDNDCDGTIDRDATGQVLGRSCYEGPALSKGVGSCVVGRQLCENGKWGDCKGQQLPIVEICGNGKDDDCDGTIDERTECSCWGTGKDGELIVTTRLELDKFVRKGRKGPDGVSLSVVKISQDSLEVKAAEGLAALDELLAPGDELVLVHVQGAKDRVGAYEFVRVLKVEKASVFLQQAVVGTYGAKDNSDLSGQQIVAVRVPNYSRVVIESGGHLTIGAWDGTRGGILPLRAKEVIQVGRGGKISVLGRGFRGGLLSSGSTAGQAGESITGRPAEVGGKDGGGHAAVAGVNAPSGGGGGHGEAGKPGLTKEGQESGKGGGVVGQDALLKKILLGSGGGAGGGDSSEKGKDNNNKSGAGGAGGGVMMLFARVLNLSGEVTADGAVGLDAVSYGGALGGGGGGAGGSLIVQAERLVMYRTGSFLAVGGKGGKSATDGPSLSTLKQPFGLSLGGAGGVGRIDLRFVYINGKKQIDIQAQASRINPKPFVEELPKLCQ